MKKWTNRDWIWLTSILIGIIIIILTWRLNDNDNIVNIISMFASGASIILAVVAIVQSTIYNSSSNELNGKMTEKLSLLENNVEFMKEKLLKNFTNVIERAPIDEEVKQEIKDDLSSSIKEDSNNKNIFSEYELEVLIYNKFKKTYGDRYEVKQTIEGITLKNNNKEILIEIKVRINHSRSSIVRIIKRFESKNDNINRILILIVRNDNIEKFVSIPKNIRLLGIDEIFNNNDFEFKEKMKI